MEESVCRIRMGFRARTLNGVAQWPAVIVVAASMFGMGVRRLRRSRFK